MTLEDLRIRAGLSQLDVGKRLNVTQSAVSHWERGDYNIARKYHKKLARLYQVTPGDIVAAYKAAIAAKCGEGKSYEEET